MNSAQPTGETRLNRTCEACRKRKIRCTSASADRCTRCSKLDIECTFKAPAIKKRRKRNEARLRELEQMLKEVQQSVSKEHPFNWWTTSMPDVLATPASTSSLRQQSEYMSDKSPSTFSLEQSPNNIPDKRDPVERGLVNERLAEELCSKFCAKILPHYPIVLPPSNSSWRTLQQDRPALFRAVLATASSSIRPDLWTPLFRDAERHVLEHAMILGRKSLDLIQAALVLATWSHPPNSFEDLNFSQFANVAATMVMDLQSSNDRQHVIPSETAVLHTEAQVERARAFSACYLICSSIAMSFRRPSALSYGPWVDDCINVLDSPYTTHVNDRRLAAWIRLQCLADETFAMAEPDSLPTMNRTDPRTGLILQAGLERIKNWRKNLLDEVAMPTLHIHYLVILLNISERGLYEKHDVQDFRPPYAVHILPSKNFLILDTPLFTDARSKCSAVARRLLKLFLELSPQTYQQVPVIVYTRLMYAVIVIIKLEGFKSNTGLSGGDLMAAINIIQLILNKLEVASEGKRFRNPALFHAILKRLLNLCSENQSVQEMDANEIIEPLRNLQIGPSERGSSYVSPKDSMEADAMEHVSGIDLLSQPGFEACMDSFAQYYDHSLGSGNDSAAALFWNSFVGEGDLPMNIDQEFEEQNLDLQYI
ncbi:Ff.00g034720.m01.CDS01 [Fusarium sp. VM40]|nr:Ff.00g034720.m01.CDS01 [Fusarium sp. VM40]